MNALSQTSSPHSSRAGRVTLLAAAPLAAFALVMYAFSGAHTEADAGDVAGPPAAAPTVIEAAPAAAIVTPEENPVLREHDAELLAYRPHGG